MKAWNRRRVPLALVADDAEYWTAIRSPFAALARNYPSDPKNAAWFRDTFKDFEGVVSPIGLGFNVFVDVLSRKTQPVLASKFLFNLSKTLAEQIVMREHEHDATRLAEAA